MKIYVGDELLELSRMNMADMYVSEGKEATVYRYGDEALKIYKNDCDKARLDEEDCVNLGKISTSRLLLPKRIIYGEDKTEFVGYSMDFIDTLPCEMIYDMDIMRFIEELDIIDEDLRILADKGVLVADFYLANLLYNGKFFIGDPGSYVFVDSPFSTQIYKNNIYELNRFVRTDLFRIKHLAFAEMLMIDARFDGFKYIGNQIRQEAKTGETVEQYVKRIVH